MAVTCFPKISINDCLRGLGPLDSARFKPAASGRMRGRPFGPSFLYSHIPASPKGESSAALIFHRTDFPVSWDGSKNDLIGNDIDQGRAHHNVYSMDIRPEEDVHCGHA